MPDLPSFPRVRILFSGNDRAVIRAAIHHQALLGGVAVFLDASNGEVTAECGCSLGNIESSVAEIVLPLLRQGYYYTSTLNSRTEFPRTCKLEPIRPAERSIETSRELETT